MPTLVQDVDSWGECVYASMGGGGGNICEITVHSAGLKESLSEKIKISTQNLFPPQNSCLHPRIGHASVYET